MNVIAYRGVAIYNIAFLVHGTIVINALTELKGQDLPGRIAHGRERSPLDLSGLRAILDDFPHRRRPGGRRRRFVPDHAGP